MRAYVLLLNEGGWWSLREISWALEVHVSTLYPQLEALLGRQHIARRGAGKAGTPHVFGVTTACVPVPGVALQEAA
jgi:hypothetical protein